MAESQRSTTQVDAVVDNEAQKKRDRMTRIMFLGGAVGVIALMFVIAKFLSG